MAQLVSTQSPLHSTRPLTVGVIPDATTLSAWTAMSEKERQRTCDLIELRLDTLKLPAADLRYALSGCQNTTPVLLTARHPAEGGQGSPVAAERMALVEPLLDLATLVDIELRSAVEMKPLIDKAHAAGVKVMGSFHDFQATPPDDVLRGAISFAQPPGWMPSRSPPTSTARPTSCGCFRSPSNRSVCVFPAWAWGLWGASPAWCLQRLEAC